MQSLVAAMYSEKEVELPSVVENQLIEIYLRHGGRPIDGLARSRLQELGAEKALQILLEIKPFYQINHLSALIMDRARRNFGYSSPSGSSLRDSALSPCRTLSGSGDAAVVQRPPPRPPMSPYGREDLLLQASNGAGIDSLSDEALLAINLQETTPVLNRYPAESSRGQAFQNPDGQNGGAQQEQQEQQEEPAVLSPQGLPQKSSQGSNSSAEGAIGDAVMCSPEQQRPQGESRSRPKTPPLAITPASSQKKRSPAVAPWSERDRNVRTRQDDGIWRHSSLPTVSRKLDMSFNSGLPSDSECALAGAPVFADTHKPYQGELLNPKPELPMPEILVSKFDHQAPPSGPLFSGKKGAFKWPEWTDQLQAFGDLSFTKRFLILDHATDPQKLLPLEELKKLKDTDEAEVDNRLFHQSDRAHSLKRDWTKKRERHLVFNCDVDRTGKCKFWGPLMENGCTPLQRAFGEENVLRVNFEDIKKSDHIIEDRYRALAKNGILCGLKRFVFYAYKDVQAKKKQGVTKFTYDVKCIFISIESHSLMDRQIQGYRHFKSIAEARSYLMHPTVPSLAKSVSRLQLALSETTQIPLEFDEVHVQPIEDVYCRDENGNIVCDANGKALIHTDGIGYISKNLAMLCQEVVIKGVKRPEEDKQEYPLMMQVRLFYNGNVWKGVLLVNCLLPDNTIQVRESMLKVKQDENLKSPTFNSLELCNTSRKPGTGKLFQHLILLLKKGGMGDDVFMKFAETALEKIRTCFSSRNAALKVALRNKDTNSNAELACQMLMAGFMPKTEPFLRKILWEMVKGHLQEFAKGKVPVPKSSYLIGCSDPSLLLERNQVAILLGDGAICRTKVLVYKPPGLHPGDIHIFEAVWNKEIEAVVGKATYGIVFSAKGPRSVTDEMAGSDLDGDQYWVCWNPEVVDNFTPSPPWEAPHEPTPPPPRRPDDEDEFEKLHFDKFLEARFNPSSIKGRAVNNWLAQTDFTMTSYVDESEKALAMIRISKLVDLFYKAVDADKSGEEMFYGGQTPHEQKSQEQLFQEASAIYTAVYAKERDNEKEYPSLQFAWKVAGVQLCQMYAEKHGNGSFYAMSSNVFKELNERDMF